MAHMSEKEWALFTASRYIDPWTGKKKEDVDDGPFKNGLDEHDVLRLFKQQHQLKDAIYQLNVQMWVGFGIVAFLHLVLR